MGHKTLTISEEAYEALVKLKKEWESFTDVIEGITGLVRKRPLRDFAGRLKDEKFEAAVKDIRNSGGDFITRRAYECRETGEHPGYTYSRNHCGEP